MSDDPVDTELTNLLDQIKDEPLPQTPISPKPTIEPDPYEGKKPQCKKPEEEIIEPILIEPEPKEKLESNLSAEVPKNDDLMGIRKLLESFIDKAQTIIDNHASDRSQVNDAIQYFEGLVKAAQDSGTKLPQAYIEGWVKLLTVKADINANASSVLDSMAKLLAAAKNNNIILNIKGDFGDKNTIDLEALLAQPETQIDE